MNLPSCVLAAWGAWRYVPVLREHPERRRLDYGGAMQSLVGLALIIFALIQGQSLGWWTGHKPGQNILFTGAEITDCIPYAFSR